MSERTRQLRQTIKGMLDAGVRRTTFFPLISESLEQTRGTPRPIRRALALAHLLDNVEQAVLPHELLAGSITGMWPLVDDAATASQQLPEGRRVVEEYLRLRERNPPAGAVGRWALMARDHYDARIRFSDLQSVAQSLAREHDGRSGLPYAELYRVLEDHFVFDYGEQVRRNFEELPWFASNHLSLGFGKALQRGLGDLRREIVSRRSRAAEPARQEFYDSTLIALDAVIRFVRRYARTLERAAVRSEPGRARELLRMAATCDRIAEDAPQTFGEAIQLVWMVHLVSNIGGGSAMSFGRFDQYLGPFYERDLAVGRVTPEEARELVAHLWLKANEPKMRTVQSLTLSGTARSGEDGTNALTYLCLDVIAEVREPYPNTCVRMHQGSPAALWEKVTDTLMVGIGQPQVFNDDAMLPGMVRAGFPEEDARDYYPMGCVEVMLDGLQPTYRGARGVLFPTLLEPVFRNGGDAAGEPCCATGDLASFTTFDAFLEAYLTQLRFGVAESIREAEERCRRGGGDLCDPFASIFVEDCLQKGVDVCQGGARYPACFTINGMGFGTAIDSLAAIKTVVYERKRYTLDEVKAMLERDFADDEAARMLLQSQPPTFGNDLEEADSIARRVYDVFTDAILGHRSPVGAFFLPQMFSYNSHVYAGEVTGATPNGRRRGTTLSDGPGPSQGRDRRGPTCLINSVAGMDGTRLIGGCGFNIKISPHLFRGPEGRKVLRSLLQAYVGKNGMQIQVNLVDRETLRKAQQSPDQYRYIIVRVAGYCEYFANLDRVLQDEIISRTEQLAPVAT